MAKRTEADLLNARAILTALVERMRHVPALNEPFLNLPSAVETIAGRIPELTVDAGSAGFPVDNLLGFLNGLIIQYDRRDTDGLIGKATRELRKALDARPVDKAAAALGRATTRDEARQAIGALTNAQLRELGGRLREGGLTMGAAATKDELRSTVVEYTVGVSADERAMARVMGTNGDVGARPLRNPASAPVPPAASTASEAPRGGTPTSAPQRATGTARSGEELLRNEWGMHNPAAPVAYHQDGVIGQAVERLRDDAHLDVDGHALGNVMGRIATDAVNGATTSQEAVERLRNLRDQLPDGSRAQTIVGDAVRELDAPDTPAPDVWDGAPQPLVQLMDDLHAVPVVRRDPKEERLLLAIIEGVEAGELSTLAATQEIRRLLSTRHESTEGAYEIQRAVLRALERMEELRQQENLVRRAARGFDLDRGGRVPRADTLDAAGMTQAEYLRLQAAYLRLLKDLVDMGVYPADVARDMATTYMSPDTLRAKIEDLQLQYDQAVLNAVAEDGDQEGDGAEDVQTGPARPQPASSTTPAAAAVDDESTGRHAQRPTATAGGASAVAGGVTYGEAMLRFKAIFDRLGWTGQDVLTMRKAIDRVSELVEAVDAARPWLDSQLKTYRDGLEGQHVNARLLDLVEEIITLIRPDRIEALQHACETVDVTAAAVQEAISQARETAAGHQVEMKTTFEEIIGQIAATGVAPSFLVNGN